MYFCKKKACLAGVFLSRLRKPECRILIVIENKMQEIITRKQIRLKNYDYSLTGYYFITVCSNNRKNIFGKISVGADGCRPDNNTKIILNEYGLIIDEELKNTENIRHEIKLDKYVIMPNHLHCIIIIQRKLSGGQIITGGQPPLRIIIFANKHYHHLCLVLNLS